LNPPEVKLVEPTMQAWWNSPPLVNRLTEPFFYLCAILKVLGKRNIGGFILDGLSGSRDNYAVVVGREVLVQLTDLFFD
jgi:hypothetical protein